MHCLSKEIVLAMLKSSIQGNLNFDTYVSLVHLLLPESGSLSEFIDQSIYWCVNKEFYPCDNSNKMIFAKYDNPTASDHVLH